MVGMLHWCDILNCSVQQKQKQMKKQSKKNFIKMKKNLLSGSLLVIIFIFSSCGTTHNEIDICPIWITNPLPINSLPYYSKKVDSKTESGYSFYYQPLLLPFSIRWNSSKGFYVDHTDQQEIATPIGTFGLEYSIASRGTINGVEITPSDFVVAIINKNEKTQKLFKIEGYNRLKVVLSGTTTIDAQSGFVQIDATKAKISKIEFFDNSIAKLINTSNKPVNYYIQVGNTSNESTNSYKCEIPAQTFVTVPIEDLNSWVTARVFIRIKNDDPLNDSFQEIKKMITYGDVCEIRLNRQNKFSMAKVNR